MKHYQQSPSEDAFVQNPYPFYDRTRANGPVFYWDDYGMACLTGHAEVSLALRDRRLGREIPGERIEPIPDHLAPFYDNEAHSMLELEPPAHTRLRGLVLRAFTSRRIAALGPEIEALAAELIAQFPSGPFDLLTAFAQPLPVRIIARLLGVPESDSQQLLTWSNAMVAMYMANRTRATEDAAVAATQEFSSYLAEFIDAKRKTPDDDLISTLIAAEDEDERLSREELISTCILLLNAGHEATVHTIGNGVKLLLETGNREISDACVEELLRFDPPLHMFTRWVYEDVEIGGHNFKRGDQIACLLGAAGRDPAIYTNANSFDPNRKAKPHVAFGGGLHFCVGAPLARLEIAIALRELFGRCPQIALAERPQYADVYHFHGLKTLMVTT